MLNLPLKTVQQKREWSTILHIVQQNGFPPTVIHKLRHQIEHKTKHTTQQQKQEVGIIHIHFPANTQGHKHIQKHEHHDNI
jgi:hypothetical protein